MVTPGQVAAGLVVLWVVGVAGFVARFFFKLWQNR